MEILHQVHKHCTLKKPIKVHEFTIKSIELSEFELRSGDLELVTENCLKIFKTTEPGKIYTTIDSDPMWWTKLVINSIQIAINKKSDSKTMVVYIPNGCCNLDKCPLLTYYRIVIDNIMNQN